MPHATTLSSRSRVAARRWITSTTFAAVLAIPVATAAAASTTVDFRYSPPEWQTAICLPDDPHKSLVDRSGELLYHYGQGGREFATRIGVEVTGGSVWQKQELLSPRVPIVRTWRTAGGLEILEEAFAVTRICARTARRPRHLRRFDGGRRESELGKTSRRQRSVAETYRRPHGGGHPI